MLYDRLLSGHMSVCSSDCRSSTSSLLGQCVTDLQLNYERTKEEMSSSHETRGNSFVKYAYLKKLLYTVHSVLVFLTRMTVSDIVLIQAMKEGAKVMTL